MVNDIPNIPLELIDALKTKRVVPFIGSGVSRAIEQKNKDSNKSFNPLFPNWKEFLDYSVEKLESRKEFDESADIKQLLTLKKPMYLEAARRASLALGDSLWHQMLKEKLDLQKADAAETSLKLPQIIWELGSNLLITTNVDRVLQWTCPNSSEFRPLDMERFEIGELQKEKDVKYPTVLYLHGRIHNKKNVVFTPEQYKHFYEEGGNQAKLHALINLLTSYTTLFIGFSMDDEYFLKQLNSINEIYEGGANSFYILLPESEKDNPNIPKYVEKIIYAHHGKPLLDLLERMREIANGDDTPDDTNSSPPPDTPPFKTELQITTSSTLSGTFSSSQKLFKSVLAEKHFNVPFASKGEAFVGREGLREKIWESLNQSGRAAIGQAVSIKGIGGLGKTQLAVEYAHAYRNRYEKGVFWLTADEDLDNQLIKIGEDLSWISQSDTGFNQAELVRNRFRKLSDCLIIFDNVDEQHPIKDYLPERGVLPHILITSREKQPGFYQIELDLLKRDEARALILNVAERAPKDDAEKENLEKILEELEDLPLAVELVGGYLSEHPTVTFEKYYKFLQEVPLDKLEAEFPADSFTRHDKSIIRTLKISEKLLETKPLMVAILDVLAWSGKSSMGISLLRVLVRTDDEFAFENALSETVKLRLIKQEENAERYSIHRLLAKVRRYEKPLEQNQEWHKQIVEKLEQWFEPKIDDFSDLAEFEAEIAHLHEWQEVTVKTLPNKAVLLTALRANPLHHRGNYQRANQWLETAYQSYQQQNVNNQKLLADLCNFLDVNYNKLGNHRKALEFQQQALEIRQELFGQNHPAVAQSLDNLGLNYSALGNYQKALEFQHQALEIRQKLLGKKHRYIGISLNNLGATYSKSGKQQKALKFHEQALEIRKELFGEKHPNIAASLHWVGFINGKLGNYQIAFEYIDKSLIMRRELLGEKHPDTILSCEDLIDTLVKLGKIEQAGRLAGDFLSYVPQNHPKRWFFEKHGAAYQKARKKKKRHKK